MWGEPAEVLNEEYAIRYIPTRVGRTETKRRKNRRARQRYIPTRVGRTDRSSGPRHTSRSSVHPHACGENLNIPKPRCRTVSTVHPHACGENEEPDYQRGVDDFRYIPTRVGRTRREMERLSIAVHPHACGENGYIPGRSSRNFGTSPRVWGELPSVGCREAGLSRYIPTRVGRTARQADVRRSARFGTSPRVWGELSCSGKLRFPVLPDGTSPRVWGELLCLHRGACISVHPHACGENDMRSGRSTWIGTSPRVWGEPGHLVTERCMVSVHPHACGENWISCGVRVLPGASTVHPHACGENVGRSDVVEELLDTVHPHACGEN